MDGAQARTRLARLQGGGATTAEAQALHDALPPVAVGDALGSWRGSGLVTGHPLDGLLEAFGWWGKDLDGPDAAHPLVFEDARGRFRLDPALLPLGLALRWPRLVHDRRVVRVARALLRLRRTTAPRARLRAVEHRGVVSVAVVYDALPVIDHLRRVDDDVLLGVMDLRGSPAPFFFVLRREARPGAAAPR